MKGGIKNLVELKKQIVSSLDWVDVVFQNISISQAISSIGFDDKFTPDFMEMFASSHISSYSYVDDFVLPFYDGSIQVRGREVCDKFGLFITEIKDFTDFSAFFTSRFDYVKFSFNGSCLRTLRSLGFDPDWRLFEPFEIPENSAYHYTRVDFAFDMLNYKPNFITDLGKAAKKYGNIDTKYLYTGNSKMSWEYVTGRQKTFRMGKGASDLSLRVYDKYLEQDRVPGNLALKYPYNNYVKLDDLRSWIRIELQVRREKYTDLLVKSQYSEPVLKNRFLNVFKFVYDRFSIREAVTGAGRHPPVCDEWEDLFDWNKIPCIIQNANSVQSEYVSPGKKGMDYLLNIAFGSYLSAVNEFGFDHVIKALDNYWQVLQTSSDPFSQRRSKSLYLKLINWSADSVDFNKNNIEKLSNGVLRVRKGNYGFERFIDSVEHIWQLFKIENPLCSEPEEFYQFLKCKLYDIIL